MYALKGLNSQLKQTDRTPLLNETESDDTPFAKWSATENLSAARKCTRTSRSTFTLCPSKLRAPYISAEVAVERREAETTHSQSESTNRQWWTNCSAGHGDTTLSRYNGLRRIECVCVIVWFSCTDDVYSKGSFIIEKRERRGGRGRFFERSIITSTLNTEKSANSGSCSEQGPVIEWIEGENKRRGRIDYLLSHWRKANISISGLCSLSLSLSLSIARHKTACRLCIENAMASSTTTAIVVKKQLQRQRQRQRQRQHQQTTPQWPKRTINSVQQQQIDAA